MQVMNKESKSAPDPQKQTLQGGSILNTQDFEQWGRHTGLSQTSKQINHAKVNKSSTGPTGPDRQRVKQKKERKQNQYLPFPSGCPTKDLLEFC